MVIHPLRTDTPEGIEQWYLPVPCLEPDNPLKSTGPAIGRGRAMIVPQAKHVSTICFYIYFNEGRDHLKPVLTRIMLTVLTLQVNNITAYIQN